MIIYTVNFMSYELAKDLKCGHHEDSSPLSVHRDFNVAVAEILRVMNEDISRTNDDMSADENPDYVEHITVSGMQWKECDTYDGRVRWKFYDEWAEGTWTIAKFEIDEG